MISLVRKKVGYLGLRYTLKTLNLEPELPKRQATLEWLRTLEALELNSLAHPEAGSVSGFRGLGFRGLGFSSLRSRRVCTSLCKTGFRSLAFRV